MRIFFLLAFRNFIKSVGLNALNLLGLSAGIIAALLIIVYADHEYHFDHFHQKVDNIFRVEGRTNGSEWYVNLGVEHARELATGTYPEIEAVVMLNRGERAFFQASTGPRFPETNVLQTDVGSRFFDLFDFELIAGSQEEALAAPHSLVLTQSLAEKYFGDQAPLGQTVYYDTIPLQVTAVLSDLPSDSHIDFDLLLTSPSLDQTSHYHVATYVALSRGADELTLKEKILAMDVAYDEYHELADVELMPLGDIHLRSTASFGSSGKGDPLQLRILLVVGGLILLITIANYLNLASALYLGKGRAVGVRKVFGESRKLLIRSLVLESFLMVLLTVPIIWIGFSVLLPGLNLLLDVRLENKLVTTPMYGVGTIGFLAFVSMVTVTFPALSLSRSPIHDLLKSKSAMNITGGTHYRNALIFFQFILLFTLGLSGWFMNRQIEYLDSKDVGFDPVGV
ncbi:MAG: ABC transporter permease, partial [Bacteroidota bacterium]